MQITKGTTWASHIGRVYSANQDRVMGTKHTSGPVQARKYPSEMQERQRLMYQNAQVQISSQAQIIDLTSDLMANNGQLPKLSAKPKPVQVTISSVFHIHRLTFHQNMQAETSNHALDIANARIQRLKDAHNKTRENGRQLQKTHLNLKQAHKEEINALKKEFEAERNEHGSLKEKMIAQRELFEIGVATRKRFIEMAKYEMRDDPKANEFGELNWEIINAGFDAACKGHFAADTALFQLDILEVEEYKEIMHFLYRADMKDKFSEAHSARIFPMDAKRRSYRGTLGRYWQTASVSKHKDSMERFEKVDKYWASLTRKIFEEFSLADAVRVARTSPDLKEVLVEMKGIVDAVLKKE